MTENRAPHDDEAWERRLRSGLQGLESHEPGGGLPGTAQVRRTHARRRGTLAVASALAAVVVTGGTVLALGSVDPADPVAPTTTTSPAPTATSAPSPSGTTPAPSTAPPSTAPPSSAPPSSEPARQVPTTVPDDFRLPHDGQETGDDPWLPVDDWRVSCDGLVVDTSGTSDFRVLEQNVPEAFSTEGVLVFPDAAAAVAFVERVRGLAACGVADGPEGGWSTTVSPVDGPWGEAVVLVGSYQRPTDPQYPSQSGASSYYLVARSGAGVAVVSFGSEFSSDVHPQPDPSVVDVARERIAPIAEQLCVFTEAGC